MRLTEVNPTMSDTSYTRSELYDIAKDIDLDGRSYIADNFGKQGLIQAIAVEAPHILDPFGAVDDLETGDTVSMNHLKTDLHVTEIREFDRDSNTVTRRTLGEEDEVVDLDTEVPDAYGSYTTVIMETNRGGRHALVCQKESPIGPSPWKNADNPHLRRWRAGDQEWMNNSTDPVFIRKVTEEDDE